MSEIFNDILWTYYARLSVFIYIFIMAAFIFDAQRNT